MLITRKWLTKPPGPIYLDLGHWFCRDLHHAFLFAEGAGGPHDWMPLGDRPNPNNRGALVGNTAWGMIPGGRGLLFDGSGDRIDFPDRTFSAHMGNCACTFVVQGGINDSGDGLSSTFADNGSNGFLCLVATEDLQFFVRDADSVSLSYEAQENGEYASIDDGEPHVWSMAADCSNQAMHMAFDGRALTVTQTNAGTPDNFAAQFQNDVRIGSRRLNGVDDRYYNGNLLLALFHRRTVPLDELCEYQKNPWQIFRPLAPRRTYYLASPEPPDVLGISPYKVVLRRRRR